MRNIITDKAARWASHAKYDERAVFQDLTNDLRRYCGSDPGATQGATKGLATTGDVTVHETPNATMAITQGPLHDSQPALTAGEAGASGASDEIGHLPPVTRTPNTMRPMNTSACPTLWGYSRQQAIGRTTAGSMSHQRGLSTTLKNQIINAFPRTTAPTCVGCDEGTFTTKLSKSASAGTRRKTKKGRQAAQDDEETDASLAYAIKRGYVYVPPRMAGSTAPKPDFMRSMLSQTSYIQAADASANTLWRKQWDVTSHQNDYTLNRKATTGVGPFAQVYWSETDSGSKFTVTYDNKIAGYPNDPEGTLGISCMKPQYVPKDVPDGQKSLAITAPIDQTFAKTDSLRWGLAGGAPYIRNLTEDDVEKYLSAGRQLKYDNSTTQRRSYVPMSELAQQSAAEDRIECRRMWKEQYTKPPPVPKGVPVPMETTQQAATKLAVMNDEIIKQREDALFRDSLKKEVGKVYTPECAADWAMGLPGPRMREVDLVIKAVNLEPDGR